MLPGDLQWIPEPRKPTCRPRAVVKTKPRGTALPTHALRLQKTVPQVCSESRVDGTTPTREQSPPVGKAGSSPASLPAPKKHHFTTNGMHSSHRLEFPGSPPGVSLQKACGRLGFYHQAFCNLADPLRDRASESLPRCRRRVWKSTEDGTASCA